MRRTDLSRPSFYVYFRDRHHLMLKVVEHVGAQLRTMSQRWYTGAGDGPALAREAMEGIVEVFSEHGPVLRALADAAGDALPFLVLAAFCLATLVSLGAPGTRRIRVPESS